MPGQFGFILALLRDSLFVLPNGHFHQHSWQEVSRFPGRDESKPAHRAGKFIVHEAASFADDWNSLGSFALFRQLVYLLPAFGEHPIAGNLQPPMPVHIACVVHV